MTWVNILSVIHCRFAKIFYEHLTLKGGPLTPRFHLSHWWREPVEDFIRWMMRNFLPNTNEESEEYGGGMTADAPLRVCAYANGRLLLAEWISEDLLYSFFKKVMAVVHGRIHNILTWTLVLFQVGLPLITIYKLDCDTRDSFSFWANIQDANHQVWRQWTILRMRSDSYILCSGKHW